jgi:hypothetical protein
MRQNSQVMLDLSADQLQVVHPVFEREGCDISSQVTFSFKTGKTDRYLPDIPGNISRKCHAMYLPA